MSKLIHPDKCPQNVDQAKVAFQIIEKNNRKINAYIEFKETNSGKNPFKEPERKVRFKEPERKQQTKQPKQSQNKATGTHDESQFQKSN